MRSHYVTKLLLMSGFNVYLLEPYSVHLMNIYVGNCFPTCAIRGHHLPSNMGLVWLLSIYCLNYIVTETTQGNT